MKKRVGLAVNWFNYPICLSQAWFQQSCSNCGRRWRTLTWRRSITTAATTATGALTCRPRPRQRTHSSTSTPPPTGSTWVTREKGESLAPHGLFTPFLFSFLLFARRPARSACRHTENTGQRRHTSLKWSFSKQALFLLVIKPAKHLRVKQTERVSYIPI